MVESSVVSRQRIKALGIAIALLACALAVALLWLRGSLERVDFTRYPEGAERKRAFIDYLLPLIREENDSIRRLRARLLALRETGFASASDRQFVRDVASEYGLEEFDADSDGGWRRLLRRVDTIPASLALAQGAVESGWGTSRFAREGANLFGLWCYREGCGMVPGERTRGARHEVARFDTPRSSVRRYLHNLNTHAAYGELRRLRAEIRATGEQPSGLRLVRTLAGYSVRSADYIDDLVGIIRFNELSRFDLPRTSLASGGDAAQ